MMRETTETGDTVTEERGEDPEAETEMREDAAGDTLPGERAGDTGKRETGRE